MVGFLCGEGEGEVIKRQEIYMRDPFVLPVDGVYYLTGTTDKHWYGGRSDGLKIYTSTDLEHFSEPVTVFAPRDDFWSFECWWAPELHFYKGRYYIFCTFDNKQKGRKGTQILVSDSALGSFEPLVDQLVTNEGWECLDATLYVEDSVPYAVYCREWTKIYNGEIYVQRLSGDLKTKLGPPLLLFDAKSAPWTVGLNNHDANKFDDYITDGPYLHRTKSGRLLMIWSSFSKDGYTVGIAASDSGSVLGPWKHLEKPLFTGDGGHAMLFRDFEGRLRMALHVNNSELGKEHPRFMYVREEDDTLVCEGGE